MTIAAQNTEIEEFLSKLRTYATGQAAYNLGTNVPKGILTAEQATASHAIKSGVVHAIGELIGWSVDDAIDFAANILEDSNAHDEAASVRAMEGQWHE